MIQYSIHIEDNLEQPEGTASEHQPFPASCETEEDLEARSPNAPFLFPKLTSKVNS